MASRRITKNQKIIKVKSVFKNNYIESVFENRKEKEIKLTNIGKNFNPLKNIKKDK